MNVCEIIEFPKKAIDKFEVNEKLCEIIRLNSDSRFKDSIDLSVNVQRGEDFQAFAVVHQVRYMIVDSKGELMEYKTEKLCDAATEMKIKQYLQRVNIDFDQ